MRKIILFLIAVACWGQGTLFTSGPQIPTVTVSALPSAASTSGQYYGVTDANPNCGTGGGSTTALCYSNGSTWLTIAGGVGSAYQLNDCILVHTSGTVVTMTCPTQGTVLGANNYRDTVGGTVVFTCSTGCAPSATKFYVYWDSTVPSMKIGTSGTTGSLSDIAVSGSLGGALGASSLIGFPSGVTPIAIFTGGNGSANTFDSFSNCYSSTSFTIGCEDQRSVYATAPTNGTSGLICTGGTGGVVNCTIDGTIVTTYFIGSGAPTTVPGSVQGSIYYNTTPSTWVASVCQTSGGCATGTPTWGTLGGGSSYQAVTRDYPAAACTSTGTVYVGSGWSGAVTNGASFGCVEFGGTTLYLGVIQPSYGGTNSGAYLTTTVPIGWTSGARFDLYVFIRDATADTFTVQTGCSAGTGGTPQTPSLNTAQTLTAAATNEFQQLTLSTLTMSGCSAGNILQIFINRTDSNAHYDYILKAVLTL